MPMSKKKVHPNKYTLFIYTRDENYGFFKEDEDILLFSSFFGTRFVCMFVRRHAESEAAT